jgi:nicotinamide phosphoribosyltransferase
MSEILFSAILNADSYKHSHFLQYPPGLTRVSSYIEARRGGAFPEAVFFGLQAYLEGYLTRPVRMPEIASAEALAFQHGIPFNGNGWRLLVERHGGLMPLEIRAAPEGMLLPEGQVMVEVVNTDPDFFWLTSFIETSLLRAVWYPTTVATIAWRVRRLITGFLERTADTAEGPVLDFALNDFGSRGASSLESAALGGMAHLVSFDGTDNLAAILAASRFYDAPVKAKSVPAAEHSTITAWSREREAEAYANMIDRFGKAFPIISVVSDSYDLDHALRALWGKQLKAKVEGSKARLVIRPDSGNPATIVRFTIQTLMNVYGSKTNAKGFQVLPDKLRVIQGDGVDEDSIREILTGLEQVGISAENVVFGMGGALLQKCNRDTLRFAMKASAVEIDGEWRDVCKTVRTDPSKASKAGRLALVREADGGLRTVRREAAGERADLLAPVFRNGEILKRWSFAEVQARVRASDPSPLAGEGQPARRSGA